MSTPQHKLYVRNSSTGAAQTSQKQTTTFIVIFLSNDKWLMLCAYTLCVLSKTSQHSCEMQDFAVLVSTREHKRWRGGQSTPGGMLGIIG